MLDRRALLTGVGALGAGLLAPGGGRSQVAATMPPPPTPGSPAPPPAPSDTDLSALARAQLDRLGRQIPRRDRVVMVDFAQPSWIPRLHLLDLEGGRRDSLLVAHGCGSDPDFTGWLKRFSNQEGSQASSEGAYRGGGAYHGLHGLSLRLDGLDPTNDQARRRDVVVHSALYVSPDVVRLAGKTGWSEGCFAIDRVDRARVLATLEGGRMLFAARLSQASATAAVTDAVTDAVTGAVTGM